MRDSSAAARASSLPAFATSVYSTFPESRLSSPCVSHGSDLGEWSWAESLGSVCVSALWAGKLALHLSLGVIFSVFLLLSAFSFLSSVKRSIQLLQSLLHFPLLLLSLLLHPSNRLHSPNFSPLWKDSLCSCRLYSGMCKVWKACCSFSLTVWAAFSVSVLTGGLRGTEGWKRMRGRWVKSLLEVPGG